MEWRADPPRAAKWLVIGTRNPPPIVFAQQTLSCHILSDPFRFTGPFPIRSIRVFKRAMSLILLAIPFVTTHGPKIAVC
jgi:hypothetical protein